MNRRSLTALPSFNTVLDEEIPDHGSSGVVEVQVATTSTHGSSKNSVQYFQIPDTAELLNTALALK
jgi:hypothetical protein